MPRNVELDHDETMTPHVRSITLVRHGRTAYNAQHRLQGQIDIPLDEVERSFGDWEGIAVEELAKRFPEDYLSWAQFRGGELKYGAEPKQNVGRRGVEALNDWASKAGSDTDLYVFSHGAWISQTLQTLLGLSEVHGDFADILSMRNAHWVRLAPLELQGTLRWRLVDYNHGPAIADTEQWEHPQL